MPHDLPVSIPDLIAFVQRFADDSQLQVERIILVQRGGLEIPLDIPCNRTPSTRPATKSKANRPTKGYCKRLLAVIPKFGETGLTAKALAGKAKVGYNHYLYRALRFLVSHGYIAEAEGKYSKTDRE